MEKILVTTDFSANSKKAIRFAMKLATQKNVDLVFYNVVNILVRSTPLDQMYISLDESEMQKKHQTELEKFIKKIQTEKSFPGVSYNCVAEIGDNVGKQIINYAEKNDFEYICTTARGSGVVEKLFGSIASHLIISSPIPVFVIPKNYRTTKIHSICYASDIENIDIEIKKAIAFSTLLHTKLKVLHYDYDVNLKFKKDKLSDIAKKYETEDIMFHYRKLNPIYSLNYHIKKDLKIIKPSLIILFTKQNRKWFDRLFETSQTKNISFNAKVPMLVYRKELKK